VISGVMMKGLILFYLVTAIVSAYEGNYPRALYWLSAGGITTGVLWGMP